MDKEQASRIMQEIYNALQVIPVSGSQNTFIMSGIFPALQDLIQWANNMKDEGEKGNGDKKHL